MGETYDKGGNAECVWCLEDDGESTAYKPYNIIQEAVHAQVYVDELLIILTVKISLIYYIGILVCVVESRGIGYPASNTPKAMRLEVSQYC